MLWLLLTLAVFQFAAWVIPADPQAKGIPYYLPLHMLMETASIVVAMLVFAVGWNSHTKESSANLVLLAVMFFVVGLLDFSHTAAYVGMPDFLSHNDAEKHLSFWLAARLLAATALLLVSLRPWQLQLHNASKYWLIAILLVGLLALNWTVIYRQESLPHLFISDAGLTPLKKGTEYFVIAINLLTAAVLWAKMRRPQPFNAPLLFGAVGVMAMSEFYFTLYTTMTGAYNVLGHIYKVIGYLLIYRAVVVESVERPYLQLALARKNLALAVEASTTGMIMVDEQGLITLTNAQANTMFGYAPGALIGKSIQDLVPPAHRTHHDQQMQHFWHHAKERKMDARSDIWGLHQSGHSFQVEIGLTPISSDEGRFVIASILDITQQVEHERRIKQLVHFDPLTGLPNRTLLHDRVNQAIQAAARKQSHVAILFLDLDHFKNVNDTLGHSTGDDLLVEIGKRLTSAIRESDTVARVGGDEFVIVLADTAAAEAAVVAAKLLTSVSERCLIGNHALAATPSIGIAIYPQDGVEFGELYQHADTAMYRTKQDGRNGYRFFSAEMQSHTERMLTLESDMQQALESQQFYLDYQPQLSIDGRRVVGVEALLRWRHPELGLISPAEFVPLAESNGRIIPIGTWVLRTATQQLRAWLDTGLAPMVMAVNLSAVQFRHPNLPALVTQILAEVQVPPEYLELELTEGVTMGNPKAAIGIMDDLHSRGVRMSIDDFGTGYSSLSYLKKFKVYKLKIDQSFVRDIATDADDRAIVTAVIQMAHSVGFNAIAEGVETPAQLQFLRQQACDEVQGYLFSKPLPADELFAFVRKVNSAG
jgi:diguanylate cyclase (GGDEF)-like protein/PAS domain S-box-containing protein